MKLLSGNAFSFFYRKMLARFCAFIFISMSFFQIHAFAREVAVSSSVSEVQFQFEVDGKNWDKADD